MATHFPILSYQFDKSTVTFYKVLDVSFEKCLLESASLHSAELTENGVQLFHRNMPFFNFSDLHAMTLILKRQDHTTIG